MYYKLRSVEIVEDVFMVWLLRSRFYFFIFFLDLNVRVRVSFICEGGNDIILRGRVI